MAETFSPTGSQAGVFPPFLQGAYLGSVDFPTPNAWGIITPWGAGRTLRMQVPEGVSMTVAPGVAQTAGLPVLSIGDIINYDFEGLIGPAGPPGPAGPAGVGGVSSGGATWNYDDVDVDQITADFPYTEGIVFSDVGGNDRVAWTTGTLRYKGVNYTIAANPTGILNTYIYWDLNSNNTTFKNTVVLATAIGPDKWVMCTNDGGTPYPANQNKVIHGGIIQADTITANNIAAGAITTTEIDADTITAGNIAADTITVSELYDEAGVLVGMHSAAKSYGGVSIDEEDGVFVPDVGTWTAWVESGYAAEYVITEEVSGSIRLQHGHTSDPTVKVEIRLKKTSDSSILNTWDTFEQIDADDQVWYRFTVVEYELGETTDCIWELRGWSANSSTSMLVNFDIGRHTPVDYTLNKDA